MGTECLHPLVYELQSTQPILLHMYYAWFILCIVRWMIQSFDSPRTEASVCLWKATRRFFPSFAMKAIAFVVVVILIHGQRVYTRLLQKNLLFQRLLLQICMQITHHRKERKRSINPHKIVRECVFWFFSGSHFLCLNF